jgi:predicted phosphodiesterase
MLIRVNAEWSWNYLRPFLFYLSVSLISYLANFEKKLQMGLKHDQIKDHFYSSPLSMKLFSEKYHEAYGYTDAKQMRKMMSRYNILSRTRADHNLQNLPKAHIESMEFSEIDNFGIEPSIGKEYTSDKLPDRLKKIGILSDIHVPFHSVEAVVCAIKRLREEKIDCLYLNGDTFDFYSISRHEKEKDLRDFPKEIEMCRNFLQKLRDIFPNIPIYFKAGNHENRYQRYLNEQAEEFAQLHEMQFDKFFRLDVLDFTFVPDWQGMEMGDLLVLHGQELMAGGMNPSQNIFNKTFCNTLIGHVHRTSNTMKKTGFKKYIHTYSTGCLTQMSPKYYPFAQHNQGFAIVTIKEGKAKVDNLVIKDGKIV